MICHQKLPNDLSITDKNGNLTIKEDFKAFYHHIFLLLLILDATREQRLPMLCRNALESCEIKRYECFLFYVQPFAWNFNPVEKYVTTIRL